MKKKDKRSKRRGGFYWINNKPYISVTQCLKILDKPALAWWFGKQVYLAMVKNPELSQQEALAAPYRQSKKAMTRGTDVHTMVENYKAGVTVPPEQYTDYFKALEASMSSLDIEIQERERTVVNEKHRYAGTLDMLALINGKKTVLDVKTGKDIYQEAWIQTAAYAACIPDVVQLAVLLLKEDGTYKFEVREDIDKMFKTFIACKFIYQTINEEDLIKVGYEL